jgi:hypothetical protein
MLLIHRDEAVSVDRLADAVIAGEPTPAASTTLRSYVARLRRVIEAGDGDPRVLTQAPGYVLRLVDDELDVGRFETALAEARRSRDAGDPASAASVLRDALMLWTRPRNRTCWAWWRRARRTRSCATSPGAARPPPTPTPTPPHGGSTATVTSAPAPIPTAPGGSPPAVPPPPAPGS